MEKRILRNILILLCAIFTTGGALMAQNEGVGIGSDNVPPDAVLNIVAPNGNKGVLMPRLNETQRNNMSASSDGLVIYNTDKKQVETWNSNVNGWQSAGVPPGGIIMWSGSAGNIPTGWALCDGSNGTPDLRGRFIVGYQPGNYEVNATGGSEMVTLTVDQMPSHLHNIGSHSTFTDGAHRHKLDNFDLDEGDSNGSGNYDIWEEGSSDPGYTNTDGAHSHNIPAHQTQSQGGGQAHENRPPYYALAFIMKK